MLVMTAKVNKKKIWNVFRILLILVIVLGGIGWTRYMRVKEFKYYDVKSESDLYNNLVGYKSGEGKMFLYSNDGARALDSSGNALWEVSYQLNNPEVAYCEDLAAVADIGGKSVYVVAENGIPYNYEVIYPIIRHEVKSDNLQPIDI